MNQTDDATRPHLKLLWDKAQRAGFTAESLRRLLTLLNVNPREMTVKELEDLLPYINATNAKKYNY